MPIAPPRGTRRRRRTHADTAMIDTTRMARAYRSEAAAARHRATATTRGRSLRWSRCRSRSRQDDRVPGSLDPATRHARPIAVASAEAHGSSRVPVGVDAVGLEGRAASLATRSIKQESKRWALELAIRCMDLTTLEGTDTTGKIVALCAKAVRPDPLDPSVPSVAAVCLYPQLVPVAVDRLARHRRRRRERRGRVPERARRRSRRVCARSRDVVEMGADEVDIVLNRSLFLGGRYARGVRRARRRARGGRRGPPQGDPGDRRARFLRPGPAGDDARDGRRAPTSSRRPPARSGSTPPCRRRSA